MEDGAGTEKTGMISGDEGGKWWFEGALTP